jgi:predicted secreted Zn-dependent protease
VRIRRPAALAALALVAACSSSPPEVPAPAAEATAAPASPAAARIALTGRELYYDIDGASAGALRDQIRRLGPKDVSGQPRDALTVWELEWAYHDAPAADGCALRDLQVTLTVTITLPRWKPPATATPGLSESWRTYLEHVKLHEAGHRTIAERTARALFAALAPLRAATCDDLHSLATRTGEEIVAEGRAKNRAYDVQTKHGQTQGVELGP